MIDMNNPVAMAQEIAQLRALNAELVALAVAITEHGNLDSPQSMRMAIKAWQVKARAVLAKATA